MNVESRWGSFKHRLISTKGKLSGPLEIVNTLRPPTSIMARIVVHIHGKARDRAYSHLIDMYAERLESKGVRLIRHPSRMNHDNYRKRLLKDSKNGVLILLDENAPSISTKDIVQRWNQWRSGSDTIHLAIGPVDGWMDGFTSAHDTLGLGPLTMTYEMAAVVLLEQLYRASEIERGSSYHRD